MAHAGFSATVVADDEDRPVAMLDQLPRHASEQASAQPRDPMRAHHDHGRAALPRELDQRVRYVHLVGHGLLRRKPDRAGQLCPLGGDGRGVLTLDAIDRFNRRRIRGSVPTPMVSGRAMVTAASPGSQTVASTAGRPAKSSAACRTAARETSEPSKAIRTGAASRAMPNEPTAIPSMRCLGIFPFTRLG